MPGRTSSFVVVQALVAASLLTPGAIAAAQDPSAPRILLNQPLRAVEYQLGRLSAEELVLVERKDDDPKYRPIYLAILTRKGIPPQYRDEAIAALVKLDKATPARVLLAALAKVEADDDVSAEKLLTLLFAQPAEALRQDRDALAQAAGTAPEALVRTGAYGAMMIADGKPDAAVALADKQGHAIDLVRGVRHLGKHESLRAQLFTPVAAYAGQTNNADLRVEAIAALGSTRADAATFDLLAKEVAGGGDDRARAAAIRSLQTIPEAAWPAPRLEALARAIVTNTGALDAATRAEPAALDAIQFGERVAGRLPADTARAIRRDLRALGVRVVRIETIPEKLSFDVRWFAVEAGKPVQIVLVNRDAMPHNLLVGAPGSLEEIGTQGAAMPMPTDPASTAKAFVPDTPLVLQATRLIKEGESERLAFTAPAKPGEYIFVCTFPGHWMRMYGVMLVVDNLDTWEAKPTVPTDPLTKQPFASQRY
jgi:uncharacterized cupredoxin-like copper-binding protein